MKKIFLLISSLVVLSVNNSCSESDLDLVDPNSDLIETIDTEDKLQKFLNGAYLNLSSVSAYGTQIMAIGDVLSDHLYVTSSKAYALTTNMTYNAVNSDFTFYGTLYNVIMNCNMVINNTLVEETADVKRIKAEAKIIRAYAYFTLVNYYSPTPSSGVNQQYGVPLVLTSYDASIQPARATVAEVYNQIISDLMAGVSQAQDPSGNKILLGKTAAKLLLSKVYLTRRAAGDAQLALQYATEVVNLKNDASSVYQPITSAAYLAYFAGASELTAENQPETIWELDINLVTNAVNGVGANLALPTLYHRTDSRRALLFTKDFYDSFPHNASGTTSTDVRRGSSTTGLLITTAVPVTEPIPGAWTNKYPRLTGDGNFQRNIKVLRFAEAQLNRIEALYLTGQEAQALSELNAFATSRGGYTYNSTGVNLRNDILTERDKEFYGEGQRFLDLKRWSLPLVKNSNCTVNCNVPANDKLFTLPMSQDAINSNANLTQYPGY